MEKFLERVDIPRSPQACWEWTGHIKADGYGRFHMDGRYHQAHRVAWSLRYGNIPAGMQINHRCRIKHCVNPQHIYLGTQKDNCRDRGSAYIGRGGGHPASKLSDTQVMAIKRHLVDGTMSQAAMARHYGVRRSTITAIKTGQNWSHVTLECECGNEIDIENSLTCSVCRDELDEFIRRLDEEFLDKEAFYDKEDPGGAPQA